MQIVAVVLLHNEDVFAERVIRNVAGFCDRIHVADHASTDNTLEVVRAVARDYDHVDVRRIANSAESHDLVAGYAGSHTWVMNPDGDELYDPERLVDFRELLEEGRYDRYFRLVPAMLHTESIDEGARTATGWLSPPSRSGGKLFNFNAIESWTEVYRQCLHEGHVEYRHGFDWGMSANLADEYGWDESPFRCLHACFMRRSSREAEGTVRLNPIEAYTHRRDALGRAQILWRRMTTRSGTPWKLEKYRRGPKVTRDVAPFLAVPARA